MVKKIKKPSQAKIKTASQTTRVSRPNVAMNKKAPKQKVEKGPDAVNIDDIILE